LSQGDRAEDAVIELRRNLMATELMGSTFESVKLASMRKREGRGNQSMREFSLEGFALEGGEQ